MSPAALAKRGILLAITGVSLYLLAPALLEVFGAWDKLDDINPLWFVAMIGLQIGSYASMWWIQKIAVRADHIGSVVTSQLASNAFGRVVPGGVAAAGAMQYAMLVRSGVSSAAAASGMTASSLLVFGTLLALPLLAVPAIATGVAVDPRLARAAEAGAVLFVAMFALGAACVVWNRPLEVIGRAVQAVRNRIMRKREPLTTLPARLIKERNVVVKVLGARWWQALLLAASRWVLDFLTLLAALYAVGATPRASLVLLAFFTAQLLGTLPLTPGGLGFVEAGPDGNAGPGGCERRRRGGGHPGLPAGVVLAADPRRRSGRDHPQPQVRKRGPGGDRGGGAQARRRGAKARGDRHAAGPGTRASLVRMPGQTGDTQRTLLAGERTYLAWWRTGLTAFAVSLGAGQIVPALTDETRWPYTSIGVAFALLGVAFTWLGYARKRELERALDQGGYAPLSEWLLLGITAAGLILGIALVVLIVSLG